MKNRNSHFEESATYLFENIGHSARAMGFQSRLNAFTYSIEIYYLVTCLIAATLIDFPS